MDNREAHMELKSYFEATEGTGVLATADAGGKVNAALYARPHVVDGETVAFIMTDRLTHANVQSNKHAAYLFIETGGSYAGKRLYLAMVKEEKNSPLIETLRRHCPADGGTKSKDLYLVYFHVDKILPLVGSDMAD
jgi:hypothetical protein